jgi:hypothetical protein
MKKNNSLIMILALCSLMTLYIGYSFFWQREKNRDIAESNNKRLVIPIQQIKDSYNEK